MPFQTFGTPREKTEFKSDFKKTLFLDLNNTCTFRILTNGYLTIPTHYINRATVQCIGEGCPVCANNKMLIMQFPDTYKDESKYSPRRYVNLVNVLDNTLVRRCGKCSNEVSAQHGSVSSVCKCGELLTGTPEHSGKIKVLSRGVTLFDDLDNINNAIMDASGERVGLTGYDITLIVSGSGKNKKMTPVPGQISPLPPFEEKDLYDLENVTIKLSATELVDLQRGVSLKDIFSARKAAEKAASIGDNIIPKEILESAQDDALALFAG